MRNVVFGLVMLGAGCTDIPEVDAVESAELHETPYLELVPLETLLTDEAPLIGEDMETSLSGRAQALQDRAQRLSRQPVIDPGDRSRMQDGVPATP